MQITIIAEIASNWEGSLSKAKKLLQESKDAGADAASLLGLLASLGFGFTIVDGVTGDVEPASAADVLRRCPFDSYVNILSQRNE